MRTFFFLLVASLQALHLSAQITVVSVRTTQTSAFDTTITFRIPEGAAQELIIREVGPTLAQFGVPNTLTDPAFELSKNGAVIAGNDNWGDSNTSALRDAFSMRGAFPLANGSKDSALLLTLDPEATRCVAFRDPVPETVRFFTKFTPGRAVFRI